MRKPDIDKLKIALLHYSCPQVIGGVEEVIREQTFLFHRLGHEVKVIAGKGNIYTEKFPITINTLFSSLNPSVIQAHQEIEKEEYALFDQLIEIMRGELQQELNSFDLLIVHNVMTMHYNLPLTYAIKELADSGKIRVISWNHDSIYFYPDCPDMYHSDPWNILKTKLPSAHYVCISESRSKQFRQLYKTDEKITVVPNGINPSAFFHLDPHTHQIIREQKLYEADLIMVQPSRLLPRKNIELAIRVVHSLKKKGVIVRYLVTGAYDPHEPKSVHHYRKLKKMAKKLDLSREVIFIAEYRMKNGEKVVPNQKFIRDFYLIADILFMPSMSEGFGLPLLEAGMIKLPVVCSDISPFREIGGSRVCYFSSTDTPNQIAKKIVSFLKSIATHRMYRNIIKNYVWDSIYETHIKPLFRKVVTATPSKKEK